MTTLPQTPTQPNSSLPSDTGSPRTLWTCLLLAGLWLSASAAAQLAPEDYRLDGGFNGGTPFLDRFAGGGGNDYRGRFVVAVPDGENAPNPDGDVLVFGEVPGYGQGPNINGNANIGIVRYNRTGERQTFRGALQFNGFHDNQYVIVPNDPIDRPSGMKNLVAVSPVINGYIYVLTNEFYSVEPQLNLIFLRRFRPSGTPMGGTLELIAVRSDDRREDAFAIDMAVQQDGPATSLLILARQRHMWLQNPPITGCDDAWGCAVMARVNLAADGVPTVDAAFGTRRLGQAPDSNDQSYFRPTAIASGPRDGLAPYIYVAGTHRNDWPEERVKVKRFDAAGDFLGETRLAFRNVAGRAENGARMLVDPYDGNGFHHLYIAAQTQQQCAPGAAVAKIDDDGALVGSFGNGGKMQFGGNDESPDSQGCAFAKFALPLGMAMDDEGRLAIAGQMTEDVDWNSTYTTGMLAVIDSGNGALIDFGGHFWRGPDNYPIGHAAFYSVIPSGRGRFTVAGDQRDTGSGNHLMFTTARLAGPYLFADGYE